MKEYDVLIDLRHNGKKFTAGDSLTLEDKEAEALLKLKVVSEKTIKLSELEDLTSATDKTSGNGNEENSESGSENTGETTTSENGTADSENAVKTEGNGDTKGKAGKK